ncbi:Protein of unknown function [Proteiniborus ethanoligenes]|uniref:DUF2680 domain-containing protein n=1 Tax=Proteiniborus ethanoligenes TaxID=415015 RepID=A0A1H3QL50_9FIRM|nr:DUF2680 domain-containing protein [Proteiniborus ethanoligenes]SDZ14033.1 Protein of unknown function [Proteiniborus ethanoligenes]
MKKKIITLTLVAIFVLSMGAMAFADSKVDVPSWFNEMISWKKDRVNEALKAGDITEEQGKLLNERIESMVKYHEEKGFNFPADCLDPNERGAGRRTMNGFKQGQRRGTMNGFRWNNN